MIKVNIYAVKKINYGVQLRISPESGDGEVLVDFYRDSKKKSFTPRTGMPQHFLTYIEMRSATLRQFLLSRPPLQAGDRLEVTLQEEEQPPARQSAVCEEWHLFTDGGCSPNPGPGGWGAVLISPDGLRREFAGYEAATTNNRMEMTAVVKGLETLPAGSCVKVSLDSRYVFDGMKWMINWKKKGWVTANGSPVKNRDLWEKLDQLSAALQLSWEWLRGHSGHTENERCDSLVHLARKVRKPFFEPAE